MAISFFTWVIIIFNLLISFWNAYSTGFNSVMLENYKGKFKDFFNIANSFGLVLSFAGAAYSLVFILGYIAMCLNYLSSQTLTLIASYNFLVFGTLLVFSGIVITIESILIAYLRRDFISIAVAIFNSIISIWNLYSYIHTFKYAVEVSKSFGGSDDDRNNAIILMIIAAAIALFLTYGFYKLGKNKALENVKQHRRLRN